MLHRDLLVVLHGEHLSSWILRCQPSVHALMRPTVCRQDEADDVAAYSAVLAEKEAAAQSAADYAARKQREVDDARAAELPAGVSIGDMENGAAPGWLCCSTTGQCMFGPQHPVSAFGS